VAVVKDMYLWERLLPRFSRFTAKSDTHLVIGPYMRWAMPPRNKRIVICCDGTFDDFGDTIERKKPGSHTSRVLRWLLPPVIFHVLWGLRVFACIKSVERNLLWTEKLPNPFHSNVSRIASAIKPRAADGTQQIVVYVGGIGALGTPQSRLRRR